MADDGRTARAFVPDDFFNDEDRKMTTMQSPTLRSARLRSVVFAAAAAVLAGCSSVKLDNEVPVESRTPA